MFRRVVDIRGEVLPLIVRGGKCWRRGLRLVRGVGGVRGVVLIEHLYLCVILWESLSFGMFGWRFDLYRQDTRVCSHMGF